jgi:hypothetical protein
LKPPAIVAGAGLIGCAGIVTPQRQRLQLTIGHIMVAIALCAVGLAWHEMFVFATAIVVGATLALGAIFTTTVRRVAARVIVLTVLSNLLGLCSFEAGIRAASPSAGKDRTAP